MIKDWLNERVSLWHFVKTTGWLPQVRKLLLVFLVVLLIGKSFLALSALFVSYVIDGTLKGYANQAWLKVLLASVGVVFIFSLYKAAESILNPIGKYLEQKIESLVAKHVIDGAMSCLMHAPKSVWKGSAPEEVALRLNVKPQIGNLFFMLYGNLLPACMEIALALGTLWALGVWSHVGVLLVGACGYLWVMVVVVPRLNGALLRQTKTQGRLTNYVVQIFHLAPLAKIYGSTRLFEQEYRVAVVQEGAAFLDKLKAISIAEVLPSLLLALCLSWVFYAGLVSLQEGEISLGVFSALFAVSASVLGNLKHMVWVFSALLDGTQQVSFPLLCMKNVNTEAVSQGEEMVMQKSVEFVNVSVKKGDKELLKRVSFKIDAGEKVWLLGASGAGKSTLLRVFNGLEEYEGSVLVDGKEVHADQMFCALVPQGESVLKGSIAFNLKIGNQRATEEQMWEALKKVKLEEVVADRAGLDSLVNPGQFSGGQLQRLSIARALLSERKMMVMDEPSSALDSSLQKQLMEVIDAVPCAFLVAMHRIEAIGEEARVLVLKNGELVADCKKRQIPEDALERTK